MPKKAVILEDDDESLMYDSQFEKEITAKLKNVNRHEDYGFNKFDYEGVSDSWKTGDLW